MSVKIKDPRSCAEVCSDVSFQDVTATFAFEADGNVLKAEAKAMHGHLPMTLPVMIEVLTRDVTVDDIYYSAEGAAAAEAAAAAAAAAAAMAVSKAVAAEAAAAAAAAAAGMVAGPVASESGVRDRSRFLSISSMGGEDEDEAEGGVAVGTFGIRSLEHEWRRGRLMEGIGAVLLPIIFDEAFRFRFSAQNINVSCYQCRRRSSAVGKEARRQSAVGTSSKAAREVRRQSLEGEGVASLQLGGDREEGGGGGSGGVSPLLATSAAEKEAAKAAEKAAVARAAAAVRREQRATTLFASVVTPTRERRVVEVELCIDIDTILEMAESQDDIGDALS